jgi:hypothetical protein
MAYSVRHESVVLQFTYFAIFLICSVILLRSYLSYQSVINPDALDVNNNQMLINLFVRMMENCFETGECDSLLINEFILKHNLLIPYAIAKLERESENADEIIKYLNGHINQLKLSKIS